MGGVHLTTFEADRDLPLVTGWVHRPHVAEWWGDPEQALAAVREHPVAKEAMIRIDARPVGFVCWQTPTQEELAAAGLSDLPGDLIDIDLFIGEPDALGRGVGPTALSQVLAKLRAQGVRMVGLGTDVENLRALRAFEKAGFRPFRDFQEGGRAMRYLVQTLGGGADQRVAAVTI